MQVLLIIATCLLASTKVLAQGRFAKNMTKTPSDALFFNGMIFCTGAVILLPLFGFNVSASGLIAGIVAGIFNVIFQMGYVFAFSCGPVSLTTMIATSSMVITIVMSAAVYGESLSVVRIIGIALVLVALYFSADKIQKNSIRLKWALFALVAFIGNSCAGLTQKIFAKSFAEGDTSSFVAVHLTVSAVLCFVIYLILLAAGKKCSYKIGKTVIFTSVFIGIVLAVFHLVYTYALSVIDATFYLPVYNGGITLLVMLGSAVLMKERLSKRQTVSVVIGIIAIVLMSL